MPGAPLCSVGRALESIQKRKELARYPQRSTPHIAAPSTAPSASTRTSLPPCRTSFRMPPPGEVICIAQLNHTYRSFMPPRGVVQCPRPWRDCTLPQDAQRALEPAPAPTEPKTRREREKVRERERGQVAGMMAPAAPAAVKDESALSEQSEDEEPIPEQQQAAATAAPTQPAVPGMPPPPMLGGCSHVASASSLFCRESCC